MILILSNNLLEIEWKEGEKIEGALCFNKPWPGMARTIYGNHERFLDTYYNPYEGCYFSGDGAMKDEKGYITVTGRMDDVINISGHRLELTLFVFNELALCSFQIICQNDFLDSSRSLVLHLQH